MKKIELLYSGKAKSVYATTDNDKVIVEYRNDTSAFDGEKLAQLANKGEVNNKINNLLMSYLADEGINTHHLECLSTTEELVKRLDMIRVECVVRNVVAGSLARRFGLPEGRELAEPIFEFFLKDDQLHDPLINTSHIHAFNLATDEEVAIMKQLSLQINKLLLPLFHKAGMLLVDYKLEFGRYAGELYLGDEVTPDSCRIWDAVNHEKMDKDRFRRDLGNVIEHYQAVTDRLEAVLLSK